MAKIQSKEFLALQAKWYGRLKKAGFDDIEHDEDHLKKYAASDFLKRSQVTAEANAEYYRLAGCLFHEHAFASAEEKAIWELHKEGVSATKIYEALGRGKKKKIGLCKIKAVIKALSTEMIRKANAER